MGGGTIPAFLQVSIDAVLHLLGECVGKMHMGRGLIAEYQCLCLNVEKATQDHNALPRQLL